jgi:hypothetical protein
VPRPSSSTTGPAPATKADTDEAARKKAKRYKVDVQEGGDAVYARESDRNAPTVADLCQLYLDTHVKSKRPVPAKTDRYTIEQEILPAMKDLKVRARPVPCQCGDELDRLLAALRDHPDQDEATPSAC